MTNPTESSRAASRENVKKAAAACFKGDGAGDHAVHQWLNRQYPKTGTCEECGETPPRRRLGDGRTQSGTEFAFLHHHEPYTRDRADYAELCRRCHRRMDQRSARERPCWVARGIWRSAVT
jgi:hypothetical protein